MKKYDRMTNREYYWRCAKILVGYKGGQPLTATGIFLLAVAWTALFWAVVLFFSK